MTDEVHQNVLIVNDDSATTRLALAALAARGIRGTVVRDVASATAKLAGCEWDLILADLAAGCADGEAGRGAELVRKVKDDFPELPVIMIT